MFNYLLRYILVLTVFITILLSLFTGMQLFINSMTVSGRNDMYTKDMITSDITVMKNGYALITGNCESKTNHEIFYKVYSRNSKLITEDTLSINKNTDLYIHNTIPNKKGFITVCNSVPKNGDMHGTAFIVDIEENKIKTIKFNKIDTDDNLTYYPLDNAGETFAAASRKNIYLINNIGSIYATIKLTNVYEVNSIVLSDNRVNICGTKATSSTLTDPAYAFYSAYTKSGELMWEYITMEQYKSTLLQISNQTSGDMILYGNFVDIDKTLNSTNTKNPVLPYIKDAPKSFFLRTDKNGRVITSMSFEKETVVNMVTGSSSYNRLMTVGAKIKSVKDNYYSCTMSMINRDMVELEAANIKVMTDTLCYLAGNEDIGVYALIHINGTNNYKLKHYKNIQEFNLEMSMLNFCRYISNNIIYFLYAIAFLIVCITTLFVLKIKYFRRKRT